MRFLCLVHRLVQCCYMVVVSRRVCLAMVALEPCFEMYFGTSERMSPCLDDLCAADFAPLDDPCDGGTDKQG
jgi:hypothetical protein